MRIEATIGQESHTTSSGWGKIEINGERKTHRDAVSSRWLTKFGDKHASWSECLFEVEPGDKIHWIAGANHGSRGAIRDREDLHLIADPEMEVQEFGEAVGYPSSACLRGRLRVAEDTIAQEAAAHEKLKSNL